MNSSSAYGMVSRLVGLNILAATTAGTITAGYITVQRYSNTINIFGGTSASPSLGTGVTQGYMTECAMLNEDAATAHLCGIEYDFGSMSGATDTYTDSGVSMPTKTIRIEGADVSIQTAALRAYAVITTTMTNAGTYTYDITYVNQDGTTGRTATIVIPAQAAVNSAFDIIPHLQAGDTGIQNITNVTLTAGNPSGGVINFKGVLPLGFSSVVLAGGFSTIDPLSTTMPMFPIANTDVIAFYRFGSTAANNLLAHIGIVADY